MGTMVWLVLLAFAAAAGWLFRQRLRQWEARKRAEEERFAAFMKETSAARTKVAAPESAPPAGRVVPTAPAAAAAPVPQAADGFAQQKMLFEAAHKAGEAGEPALAIQLYGRLLARYPATAFADQARAGAAALKKKLVKT
jgi:4-amino-4-deoxy-L-arabinose transferase-like glycosyltransferase